MPKINGRNKGASGEREFCKWVAELLELEEKPERNLEQTRSGGWDILLPPFAFEVKRVEKLNMRKAWIQAKRQVDVSSLRNQVIPVVAYRFNRYKWNGLISAEHIGLSHGYIHLPNKEFKTWLLKRWKEFGYGGRQANRTFVTTEEQVARYNKLS